MLVVGLLVESLVVGDLVGGVDHTVRLVSIKARQRSMTVEPVAR